MAWGKKIQRDQNSEIWVTLEVVQKFWGCPKNQFCASRACYWTKGVQIDMHVPEGSIDQKVNGIDQVVNGIDQVVNGIDQVVTNIGQLVKERFEIENLPEKAKSWNFGYFEVAQKIQNNFSDTIWNENWLSNSIND